jgi:hypothetical protein
MIYNQLRLLEFHFHPEHVEGWATLFGVSGFVGIIGFLLLFGTANSMAASIIEKTYI